MNDHHQISVVINTYNAERHLERVIEAVSDFDEILVCDMESTDRTLEIARKHGCRIITFPKEQHSIVEPAREFAIHEAKCEWVLVVDADEIVTPQLRAYLYEQIRRGDAPDGIAIPRKNYFMGRFLHSAYPDYVLRFFRRDKTHWPPVIHCSPVIEGRVVRIPKNRKDLAFEHLANDSVSDILRKSDTYSNYEMPRRRHKNYGLLALFFRPTLRFLKSYVLKRGFLDGKAGLIHALLDGIYQTVIVSKLIEEREQKAK
ncbi:MAG: glycosyltransferase family 2 protein [Prevotella sp.]|jgi:glycosyltransferase involved in cell wall biosynthesis|nr:glycosyltransferase family 2 protein [Prevotella sp.]